MSGEKLRCRFCRIELHDQRKQYWGFGPWEEQEKVVHAAARCARRLHAQLEGTKQALREISIRCVQSPEAEAERHERIAEKALAVVEETS